VEFIQKHGFRQIVVVGGDGTLNEVVNGLFRQNICQPSDILLGLISVGTGNDWGRMYEIPASYKKQVRMLQKRHTILQDAGQASYRLSGEVENRYFVNVAGMGYDALVAEKTNAAKQKGKGGTITYLLNLISGLFQYRSIHLEISVDGKVAFTGKVFSLSIGICKYNGGGMMQLPDAIPDDGQLDMTIIRQITRYRVVTNLKYLYDGTFVNLPEVNQYRGKVITITSKPAHRLYLETDGESLGHSPLVLKVIPKAVRLIVRKKYAAVV
jgi:YegS/Rv2252/BmrU family lipid kinase